MKGKEKIIWEGKLSKILHILDWKEILVYKTYDDEDDKYQIVALWWDNLTDSFKMWYNTEEARDKAWDEAWVEKYEKIFEGVKNIIWS